MRLVLQLRWPHTHPQLFVPRWQPTRDPRPVAPSLPASWVGWRARVVPLPARRAGAKDAARAAPLRAVVEEVDPPLLFPREAHRPLAAEHQLAGPQAPVLFVPASAPHPRGATTVVRPVVP